jgi:SAM-dependent methyltransferase
MTVDKDALVHDVRVRLFLTSFALLFFELICIRWIPAHIRYLGYFSNFILLASFLGIGLGILASRRSWWLPPFPLMLFLLVVAVARNRIEVRLNSTQVLYYGAGEDIARREHYLVLPFVIVLVVLAFIPLARPLGRLLGALPRLQAYAIDIGGSLAGIAAFFLMSWFALPPLVWFAVLAVPLALLADRYALLPGAALFAFSLMVVFSLQHGAEWSPYYKLTLTPAIEGGFVINVNNSGQQTAVPQQFKEPFYSRVYELFPPQSFGRTLIIGAGSGSDTAVALARGVPQIDAVEIDPKILDLGRRLHPDRPYDDPRVTEHVDDGRAFLRHTDTRYDLIIFALPDSLTLTSGMSSLRLESFLLTREAMADARERLNPDGLLVLYNYYRYDWFVEKLAGMLRQVFGSDPFVSSYGGWGRAAVLMAGPRLAALDPALAKPYQEVPARDPHVIQVIGEGFYAPGSSAKSAISSGPSRNSVPAKALDEGFVTVRVPPPATDDWPFLYMPKHTFPRVYAGSLLLLTGLAVVGVLVFAPRTGNGQRVTGNRGRRRLHPLPVTRYLLPPLDWHMFLLGGAFMLLETKSIVTFGLLFGSTWRVNSLVFFAILVSVLAAILVSTRVRIRRPWLLYGALAAALLVNWALPPERLLLDVPALRYLLAATLAFLPVFLANLVFSRSFRDSAEADIAFASNLLGIMAGGALEYCALVFGYRALLLLALTLYLGAAVVQRGSLRRAAA